jgi:glycosyltransferase involved in cell wall biosynthesis
MKLVFSVTNDLRYDQRMQRICRSLSTAGHEVSLVGRLRRTSPTLAKESYKQVRLNCWFERGKLFYLEYNLRLFWWLLFHRFDVYTGIDLDTLMPNLLVARLRGKKCYYDAHEYFSEVPEVVGRPAVQRFWEFVAHCCIPRVDRAYTVGPALAQVFAERYGIPFSVVRNVPLRQARIAERSRSTPSIVLYQGVLNTGRGLETTIATLQKLQDIELWLAGEGDLSSALRQLAQDLGVAQQVKFLGYLAPEELREITAQASIGLNLLENRGLSYYYSLANKAFDYVQAGVPSIQMQFPEYLALQAEHRVFYLLPRLEVEALVAAIQHLEQDQELYAALQQNCQLAAAEWCWEKEQDQLLNLYA